MSDHDEAANATDEVRPGRWRRYAIGCAILAVGGPILFVLLAITGGLAVLWMLALGWIGFLWRVGPDVWEGWPWLLGGAMAIVALAAVGHLLATRAWRKPGEDASGWRVEWTASTMVVVLLVIPSGAAFSRAVHVVANFVTDGRPKFEEGLTRKQSSLASLRNIGFAMGVRDQSISEPGRIVTELPLGIDYDATGRPLHSWFTRLLPHMEQQNLYETITLDRPWDARANRVPMSRDVHVIRNPGLHSARTDERGYPVIHYAANDRVFHSGPPQRLDAITDGLANTILIGEVRDNLVAWGNPLNLRDPGLGINRSPNGFGGPWRSVNMLMGDGSVQRFAASIDPAVLRALATPDGGEDVDAERAVKESWPPDPS